MVDAFNAARIMFDAGKSLGSSARNLALCIKQAVDAGVDVEGLDTFKVDFYAGYMAGACKWTEKQARAWLDDDGVKKRTEKGETPTDFQRSYGAARVAWSRGRELAGCAKLKAATRAPVVKAPSAQNDASEQDAATELPTVVGAIGDIDDALIKAMNLTAYMAKMDKALSRLETKTECREAAAALRRAIRDFSEVVNILTAAPSEEERKAA